MGCVFDGIIGKSVIEEYMDAANADWNSVGWQEYSDLVRLCRKQITSKVIKRELNMVVQNYWNKEKNEDKLRIQKQKLVLLIVMELGKKRQNRLNLQRIESLFHQITDLAM